MITPLFVRAHTEPLTAHNGKRSATSNTGRIPKWPPFALIIDCETTTDERQSFIVACAQFCGETETGDYEPLDETLFYDEQLPGAAIDCLRRYQRHHSGLRLRTRHEFMEEVFWPAVLDPPHGAGALIVAFNLPFDLTRLARDCRRAKRRDETWSLVMSQDVDPTTGQKRDAPFRPRIIVTPKDSKSAFIRLGGVGVRSKKTKRRFKAYSRGRFLDLRTLGWALRNESFTLDSACKAFGLPGKLNHEPSGRVSARELDYCRQDVRATVGLLNAMRRDFDQHPIDLLPDRAVSPASIVKAYLRAFGVVPPAQKFALPPWFLGIAMQAYYGGRAEARVRHAFVPTVLVDFLSQYPTVNALLGLWKFLIAGGWRIQDATEDVRAQLQRVILPQTFDPSFWKTLTWFALVQPTGDVLPVRGRYNDVTTNIGINPLTSTEPLWLAGPDVVAMALLTHRTPTILRAVHVIPEGVQAGLTTVSLMRRVVIDPTTDDFYPRIIEERARVKADDCLSKAEREGLSLFLKILANSGSYGLFVEVNPTPTGTRTPIHVWSGDLEFPTTTTTIERPGTWYCPVLAALITAGGRLLLAMLERLVADVGGCHLFCDTDSMAIVAHRERGVIRIGDENHLALSWADVRHFVAQFDRLNPYDTSAIKHILKIETLNFNAAGDQRLVHGFAIAAKRYALFSGDPHGDLTVIKASAHGLGFLYPPVSGFDVKRDVPGWVVQAWDWIQKQARNRQADAPAWFDLPAMMRFAITTPHVLKPLQARQRSLPYEARVKPHNFILSPILASDGGYPVGVKPEHFTLMAPFTKDATRWYDLSFVNMHDGHTYRLGRPHARLPTEAEAQTYGDVVREYRWHPEAKSLAPDGGPCDERTVGLLRRMPITALVPFHVVPKETDRRWEQGEDISVLEPPLPEYRPRETERLVTDAALARALRQISIRAAARVGEVSVTTIKSIRRGERIRKSTCRALWRAIARLPKRKTLVDRLPAERVESLVSQEHAKWLALQEQLSKDFQRKPPK